jgi:hypothetical protein
LNAANLGTNIYLGGNGDGVTLAILNAANLGMNIYRGGAGDGFAMAFKANVVLPVSLLSFKAEWKNEDALLTWVTANELNTAFFEVERSTDGITFSPIAKQKAAGNSGTQLQYDHTDYKPAKFAASPSNTLYYRLKTIDTDGKSSLSAIVVLKISLGQDGAITLYPNPAKQFVVVTLSGQQLLNKPVLRLTDANGKLLLTKPMQTDTERIELNNYANGIYYLTVIDSTGRQYVQKLLIAH